MSKILFKRARANFRTRLIASVAEKGKVTKVAATKAVDEILDSVLPADSDHPFLDWLTNGGFEKLLDMILKIISIFKPI